MNDVILKKSFRVMSLCPGALVVVVLALVHASASAQIELKSRSVWPSQETTRDFIQALKTGSSDVQHGLVTFARHPTDDERRGLEQLGVGVLNPVQDTSYRVRVKKQFDQLAFLASDLQPHLVRLHFKDRVNPNLWGPDFTRYDAKDEFEGGPNWVLSADRRSLNVTVRMHPGLTAAEAARMLRKYFRHPPEKQTDQVWRITVRRNQLESLAAQDSVQWIDAGPGPFRPDNDRTRVAVGVESLQQFTLWKEAEIWKGKAAGLVGRGVQVGVFDKGIAPHNDFDRRLPLNNIRSEFHGTNMAGIIGGSGVMSSSDYRLVPQEPGGPFQWRGMAPEAILLDIYQDPPHGRSGVRADTHLHYIIKHGMDLSNHSYAINFPNSERVEGNYGESNRIRDEIIRGDATSNGTPVPARLHVTSAGNSGIGDRYFTINKQLKNALVVGAWNTREWALYPYSSKGPTSDGRIKPDVLAPGAEILSTGFCAAADPREKEKKCIEKGQVVERNNFYRVLVPGTSQASAAATGVLALVLEQYQRTFGVNLDRNPPLPSTLRALMIHTARNQPSVPRAVCGILSEHLTEKYKECQGESNSSEAIEMARRQPSFKTGWGLIDVTAAVETVAQRHLIEDQVATTCEIITYSFDVRKPATGLTRVTLVWDDVPADSAVADQAPKLVNDLDLVLIDPSGKRHYPWRLDQRSSPAPRNASSQEEMRCGARIDVRRDFTRNLSEQEKAVRSKTLRVESGADRLNNVEVVDAPAVAGPWRAEIVGFKIAQGPQRFSLVGQNFAQRYASHLVEVDETARADVKAASLQAAHSFAARVQRNKNGDFPLFTAR